MLTHRAIAANLSQLAPVDYLFPGERYLTVAPLYHAAATVATFNCMAWDETLYLEREFHPAEVVRILSDEHIAGTALVPTMIQACLARVPNVAERSYENPRFIAHGASPIAEKTLRGAIASPEEITEFCRERLSSFKRPRSVEFVPELPRNPSGKVLKRKLREPYWRNQRRRVAGS